MGESRATYQAADLVEQLTKQVRRNRPELLQCTIDQLTPLAEALRSQKLNWHDDTQRDIVDAQIAAVFLDLLFGKLDAQEFDEPTSSLCFRTHHDVNGNVVARKPGKKETLTGVASDLITAAWYVMSGVDYMATMFLLELGCGNSLRMQTFGGTVGRHRSIDTDLLALDSPWAYTIATGRRDAPQH